MYSVDNDDIFDHMCCTAHMVTDVIVIYRTHEAFLTLKRFKCIFYQYFGEESYWALVISWWLTFMYLRSRVYGTNLIKINDKIKRVWLGKNTDRRPTHSTVRSRHRILINTATHMKARIQLKPVLRFLNVSFFSLSLFFFQTFLRCFSFKFFSLRFFKVFL